jgi:uncharacterized membrane protein YkvI
MKLMQTTLKPSEEKNEVVSWKKVLTFTGAVIAFLIGSGFATGQEILQYFTSYGYWGVFGTGLLVLVLMIYVNMEFITVGQVKQFPKPSMIYEYYCGKYIGTFFDYFSILFIFMSFMVMVAGAGATVNQHYGLPTYVGGITLAVLAAATVFFGLGRLVDVIGKIGPVIVIVAIALGISAIVRNPAGIAEGNALLPTLELTKASSSWFLSALSYVGFCMLWLAAFMTAMGKTANSKKEAALGGFSGSFAFAAACIILAAGLLANIAQVNGTQIPNLYLAENLSPILATGFSVIILAGIYTTAVPLLWTVASRIFDDTTVKFKVLAVVLASLGCVLGLLVPFSKMVNIVYVVNGYVGIILLVLMLAKTGKRLLKMETLEKSE